MSRLHSPPSAPADAFASLSPYERQVLEPALGGVTNKAIARRLAVSIRTVERYRASALRRLGVETLVEAAGLRVGAPVPVPVSSFDWRFAVAAPAGLADRDGRFVAVNGGLCRIFGLSEHEFLRLAYSEILHPSEVSDAARSVSRLFGGETHADRADRLMVRPDGEAFRVRIAASSVWDDSGNTGFVLGQVLRHERELAAA